MKIFGVTHKILVYKGQFYQSNLNLKVEVRTCRHSCVRKVWQDVRKCTIKIWVIILSLNTSSFRFTCILSEACWRQTNLFQSRWLPETTIRWMWSYMWHSFALWTCLSTHLPRQYYSRYACMHKIMHESLRGLWSSMWTQMPFSTTWLSTMHTYGQGPNAWLWTYLWYILLQS
jgi:hypothetical protein